MPEKKDHKNEKVSGLIDAAKFPGIAQASRHKWKSKVNSTLRENCCQCTKKQF